MLKWVEVDLAAIEENLRAVRRLLAHGTRLLAVVKADAYGHGAVRVGRLLARRGVWGLGVLTVEEAAELRSAGLRLPILLMAPPLPEQADEAARLRLSPTADRPELLDALSEAARRRRTTLGVHLDLEFGLGRWGLAPKELPALLRRVARLRGLRLEGLSTHLDYVPGRNAVEAERKLKAFERLGRGLPRGVLRHAANSAVLMDFPHRQSDLVRVGNLLYGINPTSQELALASPFRLLARVISVRKVRRGEPIGYGSEYVAPRAMTVATLPVGYADGLTMEPAERLIRLGGASPYWGILRGHPVPFVGRAGISHVLVDCSAAPNVKPGELVALPVRRTAASPRLPRVYKTRSSET